MDVRQFDFLAAQPSAELKPRETFCGISKRALALLLINALFWQPIWAQAEGIVVSNGNGARLDQAGNGVPIVNIATPGANGLSHNQFQDYNVDSRGVILNNVTDRTGNTQLGGIIVGNPNLKGAAAGVILNEVVGGSPSQLKGYTEVAGQSARVIVANPYGVTCNGCGFLNTPRVTLTTGKPVLDGNRLDHFQVDGGSVSIEGNGLNADNVDQFDIVTRSAKLNAELHARQLTIVAGRNDVAADSLAATPRAASPGDAPQLAIDSSALGGMYANTIRLVGTEAGVGVRLAGNLAASAGDIQLDANGQLTLAQTAASGNIVLKGQGLDAQGPVYAGGSVSAQSAGDLKVRQSVAARNAITLTATGQLTNGGIVEAGVNPDNGRNAAGDVSLQGAGISNRGAVIASRGLTATTAGTLDNSGSTLSAGSQAQLTAATLGNAQGRIQSRGGLSVQATTLDNTQGVVTSAGALTANLGQATNGNGELSSQERLTLRGQGFDNRQGKLIGTTGLDLTLGGHLDNRGGNLVSHGDLQVRVTGNLDNRQQGNVYGAGTTVLGFDQLLNGQGVLAGDATLALTGNLVNNDGGQLGSQGNLTAILGSLDQLDGQFISQGQLSLIADRLSNTGNGLVAANGGLDLRVGTVDNRGGEISSQNGGVDLSGQSLLNGGGKVIAGTVLTAHVATLDNSGRGVLSARQGLQVAGASLANDHGGLLTSGGTVQATLSGVLANAGGQILSEGATTLVAASLDNRQGIVSSAGQQSLTVSGVVQNDGGQLVTDSGLTLSSASLDNGTGVLSAKGAVSLTTTGAITNAQRGRLIGSDTLTVNAGSVNNAGRLASAQQLTVTTANLANSGELFSQAGVTLDLQNGTLTNASGGLITAPGALLLNNLGSVRNAGELSSTQALILTATSLDNSGGKLISNAGLTLRIARALINARGLLSAAGLDVQAASLANQGGTLVSRGALGVTTGLLDNGADGLLSAATTLDVTAATLNNAAGSLLAKDGATISSGQLDNTANGLISSQAGLILTADRLDSSSQGEVSAKGDLRLILGELKQHGGRLIGEGAVSLDLGRAGGTGNLDNTGGLITTAGVLSFAHLNRVTNAGGEIGSSQSFSLVAQALDNTRGKLISQGLLSVHADQLTNAGGLLSGWQGLGVTGGNLSNRQGGTLSSKAGDVTATLTGTLDNGDNGALVSQGALTVTAANLINSGGVLSSGAAQTLAVADALQNGAQGLIDAGTTLSVSAGQFANTGGTAQAKDAVTVTGGSLDNSYGTLNGRQAVTLDLMGALTNTRGAVLAQGDLLLKSATVVSNAQGRLNSGGLLTLLVGGLDNRSGGTVAAQGNLLITTAGRVLNGDDGLLASQGGTLSVSAGSLDNASGTLQSASDLTLASGAGDIGNVGGKIIAQNGDLHITGTNLDSRGGVLASLRGAFTAGLTGLLRNGGQGQTGGTIQAQRLDLTAATLDNYNGEVLALGGDALLQAGRVDNRNGSLYGKGLVQVRGGSFDNSGDNDGKVFGNQIDFSLSGALNNRQGIIESSSTLSLAAASLDNTNGQLRALGTSGTTQLTLSGTLNNTNGRLESANQNLQLSIGGLANTNGTLLHVGTGTFGLGLPLLQNAGGSVTSNGTLTLSGSSWTNSSTLQVANLAVNVDTLIQTGSGQLLAGNSFTGTGSNWTNDGIIAAGGNLSLSLGGTYQGAGRISSGFDFTLNAGQLLLDAPNARLAGGGGSTTLGIGGLLRNQGRLTAAGNASLSAGQIDNYGTLGATDSLIVTTPTLNNQNGLIFSGGDMGLWVHEFTNRYADVYSLGRLQISDNAEGDEAYSIVNQSGTLTSDGDMRLRALRIENVRDVLTVNDVGIYTAEITEKPCTTPGTGNLDCSGKQHHVWEILQRDKVEVAEASAASSIATGGNLSLSGMSFLNSSSSVAAGGNLTATFGSFVNQGVETGDNETTRIFVSQRTRDASGWYDAAASFNDQYWYRNPGYNAANLGGLQAGMSNFIAMTEREVTELGTRTQLASGDQRYAAVIQAGGAVDVRADSNFTNSAVRPGYTYVSGGQRTDTTAPGTSFATVVTLNSQLPPNLAQQQVSPTTLPDFTLPSGQNGLFRLSDQQGERAQANQGSAADSVAKTSIALGLLQNAVSAADASASTVTTSPSANVQGSSYSGTAGVQGVSAGVGQNLPHRYLVETNPALTDLKQFLSSDYLLGHLNYNPDTTWKRLGDGLYEQRLIQQAIVARTGQRFIDGLASDEAQFKYLMDNALASKKALNLSVGVSLTAEQVAALTHDIVWMEDQVVNGQHVLVPVLYLAQANNRLAANGALIQGSDVTLIAGNDLTNAGTLRASKSLSATATNNLVNSGLIQAGDRLSLLAGENLTNRAGGVIAGRDVSLQAIAGDVLNERTVTSHQSASGANSWRTDFADSAARIEAANDLTLQAGRDISNSGGVLSSGRDLTMQADRDVNLSSAQVETYRTSGPNFKASNITQLGGTVVAARDLSLEATRHIQAVASNLSAGRDASLYTYEGDVTLSAAANQSDSIARGKKMATESHQVTQQSTTLSAGGDISIDSGKDLSIIGSTVRAGTDIILNAVQDTTVAAAKDESSSSYFKKKKGSLGKSSITQQESYGSTNIASVIEAGNDLTINASKADDGSISLDGGRNVNVIGSQLRSGNDLLLGATQDVNILSGSEEHGAYSKKTKSGSFGLSKSGKTALETSTTQVSSEIEAGQDAVIVAGNDVRVRGSNVSAGRDAELRAGVVSGTGDVTLGTTSDSQYTYSEQYKKKFGLSSSDAFGLAIGTPSWGGDLTLNSGKKSGQESTSSSSVGSFISAERDVTLKAARDVNVVGSGVSAGRTATLDGGRDVNVVADTNAQSSSEWQARKTYGIKQTVDSNGYTTFIGNETIKDKTTNYGFTAAASQIDAGLDINIMAKRDVLVRGADLYADNDINLRAQRNIRIDAANERNETTTSHSQNRTGTTTSVNYNFGNTVDAVRGVGQGENTVSQVSGGLKAVDAVGQYLAGPTFDAQAGSNRQGQTVTQISQSARGSSLSAGNDINLIADNDVSVIGGQFQAGRDINVKGRDVVFDVARGVDTSESQQDQRKSGFKGGTSGGFKVGYGVGMGTANQDSSQGTSSATQLDAGRNINLKASNDLTLVGTQANANNDLSLSAGNDLTIRAAGNDSRSDSNRHSGGAEAGITVGRDGLGVYGSVNIGRGQLEREGVQQQEAYLYGGGKVSFTSGRDTTVAGATIRGQDVAGDVGRNLTVSSLPDTGKASGREYDASLTVTVGYGASVSGSVGYGETNGQTNWVNRQTGITAADSLNIRTGNHTQLDGAVLASDNGNLKLDTGSLGFRDIAGEDREHGYYLNVGGTYGLSNGSSGSTNAQQDPSQVGKGKTGVNGWSVEGYDYQKDREQIVRATVGAGEITVRQDAETGQDSTAGLNRDKDHSSEITKDESSRTDFYASDSSIKAVADPKTTTDVWAKQLTEYDKTAAQNFKEVGLVIGNQLDAFLHPGAGAEAIKAGGAEIAGQALSALLESGLPRDKAREVLASNEFQKQVLMALQAMGNISIDSVELARTRQGLAQAGVALTPLNGEPAPLVVGYDATKGTNAIQQILARAASINSYLESHPEQTGAVELLMAVSQGPRGLLNLAISKALGETRFAEMIGAVRQAAAQEIAEGMQGSELSPDSLYQNRLIGGGGLLFDVVFGAIPKGMGPKGGRNIVNNDNSASSKGPINNAEAGLRDPKVNQNANPGKIGREHGAVPNANEVKAGEGLSGLGYDVTYKETASSKGIQGKRTADLEISGVGDVDVYTPVNNSSSSIVRAIEKKSNQADGVLVQVNLPDSDMASIAARMWGKTNAKNIKTIFFQNSNNEIKRFDRPE
ncbi:MAG: hemagglutinin repeat-containing protein [Pseudomonas oryzihabitans]